MNEKYCDVGQRILLLRKERRLTREKLAEMADISVQFLADIEKGRKNMTVTTLRKVSAALFVTTDYIVNGKENSFPREDNEFIELYKTLSPEERCYALSILRTFAQAINQKKFL